MAFTEEEEGKLRAIIAIFDGQAPSLSSDVAAKCPALFAAWDSNGRAYAEGERVSYEGELYTCLQAHTSQPDWSPTAAPSPWAKVLEAGTPDTPTEEVPEWVQPDSTIPTRSVPASSTTARSGNPSLQTTSGSRGLSAQKPSGER